MLKFKKNKIRGIQEKEIKLLIRIKIKNHLLVHKNGTI
jgi:hypothetical protein